MSEMNRDETVFLDLYKNIKTIVRYQWKFFIGLLIGLLIRSLF
jgi:hypothetical protein